MLEIISNWVINVISSLGYLGIILTMTIESALIPLPSEIIMPFSGYLVSTGKFNLHLVALSGALGNVIGSLIAYGVGYWGSETFIRDLIRRYGKWVLISEKEFEHSQKLLNKYEDVVVLASRVLPGVRTVISLPCGIAKVPIKRFILLTFFGSLIWSYLLAWIGFSLGKNWDSLGPYFHKADALIAGVIIVSLGIYVYHKVK